MKTAKSLTAQMKEFFGLLPGQTLKDFAQELKALSEDDKAQFTAMLEGAGYPVQAAPVAIPSAS